MSIYQLVGNNIKEEIASRGMTIESIADQLNVCNINLEQVLSGLEEIPLHIYEAIAGCLNVSITYLIDVPTNAADVWHTLYTTKN